MAFTYKDKIDPQKYYTDVLSQGIRPDGRSFTEFRNMSVNVKSLQNADGSAIVKIGNTAVVCGIKAELTKPKPETPDQGYLVANIELPPLCSSHYQPGPPSDYAQEAAKFLDETLKICNCLDLKDLCIVPNELVWVLHLDIICINQDGSVLDACMAASIAALKVTTLPKVTLNPETGAKSVDIDERKLLNILKFPAATTFAVFNSYQILTDPTFEEEALSTGTVTVVIEALSGKLCGMLQPGSDPLEQCKLKNCIGEAQKRAKSVRELIKTAIGNPERL